MLFNWGHDILIILSIYCWCYPEILLGTIVIDHVVISFQSFQISITTCRNIPSNSILSNTLHNSANGK